MRDADGELTVLIALFKSAQELWRETAVIIEKIIFDSISGNSDLTIPHSGETARSR